MVRGGGAEDGRDGSGQRCGHLRCPAPNGERGLGAGGMQKWSILKLFHFFLTEETKALSTC